jgi:hypothetical protein
MGCALLPRQRAALSFTYFDDNYKETMLNFGEKPNSRTGASNPPSETRQYFASGSTDRLFVTAYAQYAIPAAVLTNQGVLYRQNIEDHTWNGPYCELTATYGKQDRQTGAMRWSFDTTGGTVNVKAAIQHISTFPDTAKNHAGAIGVDLATNEVAGTDVVIPAGKISVSFSHPAGFITITQAKRLMRNTGKVNSDTFLTFAPGEVLFLGATGSDGSDSDAEVAYQFAVSENLESQVVGTIENVSKQGWDYAWVEFQHFLETGTPLRIPMAVHVERVYYRTSFGGLFGFA